MSDLLERLCSEENLQLAFQRACYLRNQEKRQGFLNPFENQYIQHDKEILLAQIQTAILSGSYAPAAARIYYTAKGKYAHRLRGTEPTPSNYLSERILVRWLKQMCGIVKEFHAHGLVLGGVNLGHLIIDKTTENLKVFNFVLNPVQHPFQSDRRHWGSPAQDIYSLGVVLYTLATLDIPKNYWEKPHDEPDWLAPKYEKNLAYHLYPSGFYQFISKTTGYDCAKLSIHFEPLTTIIAHA